MKMNGLVVLALLALCAQPRGTAIEAQVIALCDALLAARSATGYFQDAPGQGRFRSRQASGAAGLIIQALLI